MRRRTEQRVHQQPVIVRPSVRPRSRRAYEVWVGVVAGGASGSVANGNVTSDAYKHQAVGPLSGASGGDLVVVFEGSDNTTTPHTARMNIPGFVCNGTGQNGLGCSLGVGYFPGSGKVAGFADTGNTSLPGYYIVGTIT